VVGLRVAAALADLVEVEEALAVEVRAEAGNPMRTKEFLSKLEHDRIVKAIRDAESKTSGEIRVFIQRGELKVDPLAAAQKRFHRLGMQKTPERNAVLVFVAPRAHKFAIVGDKAIHQKCGEELWQRLVTQMREHFRKENFTDAIVDAIREIGEALAAQFPRRSTSTGGLPDEVAEG
jgi:uncharacterized membrane protein